MSEKRTAANRRNAKLSTGPISTKGKRKSALNAVKHGLSIPTDRADDTVLALAALLSPTAASAHISALAVEAARRIVDFNRVKRAYLVLYAGLGSDPILIDPATQTGHGMRACRAGELDQTIPASDGAPAYNRRSCKAARQISSL